MVVVLNDGGGRGMGQGGGGGGGKGTTDGLDVSRFGHMRTVLVQWVTHPRFIIKQSARSVRRSDILIYGV